jgi:hypothetical protein
VLLVSLVAWHGMAGYKLVVMCVAIKETHYWNISHACMKHCRRCCRHFHKNVRSHTDAPNDKYFFLCVIFSSALLPSTVAVVVVVVIVLCTHVLYCFSSSHCTADDAHTLALAIIMGETEIKMQLTLFCNIT